MNILKPFRNRLRRTVAVTVVALVGFTAYSFEDNYFEVSKNLDIYSTLIRELNLYYVDEINPGDMVTQSIDAMLDDLDPYTVYIPESKIEDYRVMLSGEYGGIGALIGNHDGVLTVSEPYDGFPANEAGLKAGDIIIKVDGENVEGRSTDQVSQVLKGAPGSDVTIEVERAGERIEATMKRENVKIPDVPYYGMLDETTGYIKLTQFTETASSQVITAFNALKNDHDMKQLVFDLRGNGGGLLIESVNIVNIFVPRGQEVVSTKGKVEKWNRSHQTLNQPLDTEIPVVVVVDGGSASASEIVSGSLQDLDRAVVLGETTYGKGLVQQPRDLTYGSKLKVTIAKYYTPSGRCIQKIDYSSRGDDGQAEEVPDSLVKAFSTKNGREVFDGRGVEPDVKVEKPFLSNIGGSLIINHLIFNYATKYARSHDNLAEPEKFRLTDAEYDDFLAWVSNEEFEYETQTMDMLASLEKTAEREKYDELAKAELAALRARLTPNKTDDLTRFKSEIKQLLEDEIVSRYYLREGRIRYGLSNDPFVEEAITVLNDKARYDGILSGK